MAINPSVEEPAIEDAALVARCRAGETAAFAHIVARYQSLICALTYSATGNVHQSEDLAQETFVAAWKSLPDLREPAKLRAWLCGIARNRALNRHRDNRREPSHAGEPLENLANQKTDEPNPATLAMAQDEHALVWRALEEMPETYREPLVLYYRQNQSVENVAGALDLTEDAVKQRLARGRNMLQERVLALVEGTLGRTNPGPVFTANVMAAIPIASTSLSKTAALATATTAKGVLVATKATGFLGVLNILLGPLIGLLAGLLGVESGLKAFSGQNIFPARPLSVEERKATREARKLRQQEFREKSKERRKANWEHIKQGWRGFGTVLLKPTLLLIAAIAVMLVSIWLLSGKKGENPFLDSHWILVSRIGLVSIGLGLCCLIRQLIAYKAFVRGKGDSYRERQRAVNWRAFKALVMLAVTFIAMQVLCAVPALYLRQNPALVTAAAIGLFLGSRRLAEGLTKLIKWSIPDYTGEVPSDQPHATKEFRSPWSLLGLPLLHLNTGRTPDGKRGEARGWLAIGGRAVGVVAIGDIAVGIISIGRAAMGLVAIGGVAVGPLAIGCLAFGQWTAGGLAVGGFATGGLAFGLHAASGSLALAQDYAQGSFAYAAHINGDAAQAAAAGRFFPAMNSFLHRAWIGSAFLVLFGFSLHQTGTFAGYTSKKLPKKPEGGFEHKLSALPSGDLVVPALISLALSTTIIWLLTQDWKKFEAHPFAAVIVVSGLGLLYLLGLLLGSIGQFVFYRLLSGPQAHEPDTKEADGENGPLGSANSLAEDSPRTPAAAPQKPPDKLIKYKVLLGLTIIALIALPFIFAQIAHSKVWLPVVLIAVAVGIVAGEFWFTVKEARGANRNAGLKAAGKTLVDVAIFGALLAVIMNFWSASLIIVGVALAGLRFGLPKRMGLD